MERKMLKFIQPRIIFPRKRYMKAAVLCFTYIICVGFFRVSGFKGLKLPFKHQFALVYELVERQKRLFRKAVLALERQRRDIVRLHITAQRAAASVAKRFQHRQRPPYP